MEGPSPRQRPERYRREALVPLLAAGVALLFVGCARTGDRQRERELARLDPAQIARGRAVYLRNCASCHGQRAEGARNWTEPDARGNLPPPPHDDTGHTWRHSDRELAEMIRNGWRDPFNKTPEITMPPFKDRLSDEDLEAVITYFKSLWSEEHRRWQLRESQQDPVPPSPGK
ncbi:MAG: c-type cytochrome, partial [bacterium]